MSSEMGIRDSEGTRALWGRELPGTSLGRRMRQGQECIRALWGSRVGTRKKCGMEEDNGTRGHQDTMGEGVTKKKSGREDDTGTRGRQLTTAEAADDQE